MRIRFLFLIGGLLAAMLLSACGLELVVVTPTGSAPGVPPAGSVNGFPQMTAKPAPQQITYKGCPPQGDGSDLDLNQRKNRVDDAAQYFPVSLETMVSLPFPDAIGRKQRKNWSSSDASAVAQFEGVPVIVEGYLLDSKKEGPESTNCHAVDEVDFHIWIGASANADKTRALVAEITPRVQSKHKGWDNSKLERLDNIRPRVRLSGWVMMDQEHPEQLGQTRGTLWEIHPVMQFEVEQNGRWVTLDDVK